MIDCMDTKPIEFEPKIPEKVAKIPRIETIHGKNGYSVLLLDQIKNSDKKVLDLWKFDFNIRKDQYFDTIQLFTIMSNNVIQFDCHKI